MTKRLPDGSLDVKYYRDKYPAIQKVMSKDKTSKVRRKKTHFYMGEECTVKRLAEIAGVPATTVYQRIRTGWTIEQTVTGDKPHGMTGIRNAGKLKR